MRFLYRVIPDAIVLSFAGLILYLRLNSQGYNNALNDLVSNEVARYRRRLTRRYLDMTAQARLSQVGTSFT